MIVLAMPTYVQHMYELHKYVDVHTYVSTNNLLHMTQWIGEGGQVCSHTASLSWLGG